MRKTMKNTVSALIFSLLACLISTVAMGQIAANGSFSYQGELIDNGSPAND